MPFKKIIAGGLVLAVLVVLTIRLIDPPDDGWIKLTDIPVVSSDRTLIESTRMPDRYENESGKNKSEKTKAIQQADDSTETSTLPEISVYITGEVKQPGVYSMPQGTLLEQAIRAAGGLTDRADLRLLNLAEIVKPNQKYHVPDSREVSLLDPATWLINSQELTEDQRVNSNRAELMINLNQAKTDELLKLKGIGRVKAEAIIRYREANGKFSCIEDIMKVPGIKEAGFAKIKDHIYVEN